MADKKNTGIAIVAYLIFFLPLLTEAKKDPFVKYHVRQGLGVLIAYFALSIGQILFISPILERSAFDFIHWGINLFLVVLMVLGIMNASKGEEKPLPLIGKWANKLLKF